MLTEGEKGRTNPGRHNALPDISERHLLLLPQLLRLENLPASSAVDKHCFAKRAGDFLGDTQTPKANALFLCSIWGSTKQLPKLDNEVQREGKARLHQKGHF